MSKKEDLEKIAEEIKNCEECKRSKFGLPVPGEGSPNAKIVFLGEALAAGIPMVALHLASNSFVFFEESRTTTFTNSTNNFCKRTTASAQL